MSGLRALLRLAVRDARRDRGRALLVLLTVAVPVAGLVAAVTLTDSTSATAAENATGQMGRADVWLLAPAPDDGGPAGDAALLDAIELPAGAEVEVSRTLEGAVAADGLALPVLIEDVPLAADALASGRRQLVEGERPIAPGAVAVSTALAAHAGLEIGTTVDVDPLGAVTVVGLYRAPEQLLRELVLVAPGSLAERSDASSELLIDLPPGASAIDIGGSVAIDGADGEDEHPLIYGLSRDRVLAERFSRGERWLFIIVGGLAAVEVALIAGAAFAVSVRRRQRELGLLAATGATQSHVRRSVLLLGVTVGAVGSVLGVVVGLGASWAALPLLSGVVTRVITGLRVDPIWAVGAAGLAVSAAVAGAWWPARSVARLPVLTALSGRRPPPNRASRGLVAGLVLVGVGVGLCLLGNRSLGGNPFVFLTGSVVVVLGAGLTSPWLLEQLGRAARFLPVGPRLAVRDAARFRTRNGPIVTAAMAGLAASITIGAIVTSLDAQEAADYRPSLPDDVLIVHEGGVRGAADAVAAAVGERAWSLRRPVDASVVQPASETGPSGEPTYEYADGVVADPAVAAAFAGDAAAEDLAAGRAVSLRDTGLEQVELRPTDPMTGELGQPVATFPVTLHANELTESSWRVPQLLLPPTEEVLATLTEGPGEWTEHVILLDRPVDEATLRTAAQAAAGLGTDVTVEAERGYRSPYAVIGRVATIIGGLAGLLIVSVAIALAAAESRADLRALTAVGSGRRTRRSLAAGRALLLSGLGGLLAIPVGLLPAASLLTTLSGRPPLVLPWVAIGVVALLVPSLATLGAVLASRREPAGLTRAA